MKRVHQWLLIVFVSLLAVGCTRVDDSFQGVRLSIQLRADLEAETVASGPLSRFSSHGSEGTYTPSHYYLGARTWSLIECQDASRGAMRCPGYTGVEVERHLGAGEHMRVQTIVEDQQAFLVYAEDQPRTFTLPEAFLASPSMFSGIQVEIDFIMTRFPLAESAGFSNTFHAVLYCMNQNGCSSAGASYRGEMFTALAEGDVGVGDLVLYDGNLTTWFYWDIDNQRPVAISDGPPRNRLRQETGAMQQEQAKGGSWIYNASFGAREQGLEPLHIRPTTSQAPQTLTIAFAVEHTMSIDDANSNRRLDPEELWSLRFGKPRMTASARTER